VGLPGSHLRRLGKLALAGLVYVVVALSWLTATLIAPAHDRPYAIGSTNGSAWNAAFVFNGTERLGGKSPEPGANTEYEAAHRYPVATQSERDHIPIVPPSPTRLLARIGPLSGERLGLEVLVGLLLGLPALLWSMRTGDEPDTQRASESATPAAQPPPDGDDGGAGLPDAPASSAMRPAAGQPTPVGASAESPLARRVRMRRGSAVGLAVWMLTGIVLFSHMTRLHPRYVEGFTPVVAAMLGIGVAWASSAAGRIRLAFLAGTLLIGVYYSERLLYGRPAVWWVALAGTLGALALAVVARLWRAGAGQRIGAALATTGVATLTLVAVLAIPLKADVTAIHDHVTDAGYVGALPSEEQSLVSSYLRTHQRGAFYEVAAESATQIGSLIVQDARPVIVLTTYAGRVFTSVSQLRQLIAEGKVRYAFLNSFCTHQAASLNPACSAPAKWVRAHGRDVSLQAGLSHHKILYLLPGAKP
jgi:hypothetical protein